MHNPLDSLRAAHAAGYAHGMIVGGLVFGMISVLLTAVVLSWFLLRPTYRPDPEQAGERR
jgi:hypothetical protein